MLLNEFRYKQISQSDGLELSVLRIEPESGRRIKGIVQLVHGMGEHKERYVDFMKYLAGQGYITVIHDNRGHGESVRDKDDLGYMYEGGYRALVEDIHEITIQVKQYAAAEFGEEKLPFFLLGHSMGSLAVRCYLKKYDHELDGLMVLGCPSSQKGLGPGLLLVKVLSFIKGERAHSKLMDYIVMDSRYEKKFKKEGRSAWLNSDSEKLSIYRNDPLCGFSFTLNGYRNLLKLFGETYGDGGYVMKNRDVKIKFFSGREDPCAASVKAYRAAMLLIKKQGYKNVDGKMYARMRHEVLFEKGHDRVYRDILGFMEGK